MWMLVLVGCFGAAAPGGGNDAASAVTQGGAQAKDQVDAMKIRADLANIRAAIKLWRGVNEGTNPPDVATLRVSGMSYPERYTYDPATGEVSDPENPSW